MSEKEERLSDAIIMAQLLLADCEEELRTGTRTPEGKFAFIEGKTEAVIMVLRGALGKDFE